MLPLDYAREKKRRLWPLVTVMALLFVFFGYEYWKRRTVSAGTLCRTKILAIDAATGAQLNPVIGSLPIGNRDTRQFRFVSMTEGTEIRWYSDKPLPISVEVPDYQKVELLLTPNSPPGITVHLKR